jgi:hypothetical protein
LKKINFEALLVLSLRGENLILQKGYRIKRFFLEVNLKRFFLENVRFFCLKTFFLFRAYANFRANLDLFRSFKLNIFLSNSFLKICRVLKKEFFIIFLRKKNWELEK